MDIICDHNFCTACQACKSACPTKAITMRENERGFYYPIINQALCIDCHKCQDTCPKLSGLTEYNIPLKTYAGWIKDDVVRHYSTSGGAAYALSKEILEKGGVVCGCRWNKDHAEHIIVKSISDLPQLQGSKYAQSDLRDCFQLLKRHLQNNIPVLFIGTGCQIAGLKSYLKTHYENLTTVDVLCHGIPSQKALQERIRTIEKDNGESVSDIRFKDKREDQTHTYLKYALNDGSDIYCSVYEDPFFRGFDSYYLLRPNCFTCDYAQTKRVSDITLADFWGYYPNRLRFFSYKKGVSLILANTERGVALINQIKSLSIEERSFELAKRGNRNLSLPQARPLFYEEFWQRFLAGEDLQQLALSFFPPRPIPPVATASLRLWKHLLLSEDTTAAITSFLRKYCRWLYRPALRCINYYRESKYHLQQVKRLDLLSSEDRHIFYLGITEHSNLGDMAQHYCIKRWIKDNYPSHELVMFESSVITDPKYTSLFFSKLRSVFTNDDRIIIQSGYSTQDLGGNHPLMHRLICEHMREAKILMMPQTIFFKDNNNRLICSENHNQAKNMLFLARDRVSYEQALEMFPDIRVALFPDIVTTLIGTVRYNNKRNGVCLCTRNDGEKLYSKNQLDALKASLRREGIDVTQKDTQINASAQQIRQNLEHYLAVEIDSYSRYKVTITDRYHGTIFSLCASTPVIIIQTNDHKVTTGADWFKGVYDDFVYVADDLNDAFKKALLVLGGTFNYHLKPFFKEHYYNKLKQLFESGL